MRENILDQFFELIMQMVDLLKTLFGSMLQLKSQLFEEVKLKNMFFY